MTAKLRQARPTDGIRVMLLPPDQKKKGVDWSKQDLQRRLNFGAERRLKELEYAATREALARQRFWGWLRYGLRDIYRWATGYVPPEQVVPAQQAEAAE